MPYPNAIPTTSYTPERKKIPLDGDPFTMSKRVRDQAGMSTAAPSSSGQSAPSPVPTSAAPSSSPRQMDVGVQPAAAATPKPPTMEENRLRLRQAQIQRAQLQRELLRRNGGTLYGKSLNEKDAADLEAVRSLGDEINAIGNAMSRPSLPRRPDGSIDTNAIHEQVRKNEIQLRREAVRLNPAVANREYGQAAATLDTAAGATALAAMGPAPGAELAAFERAGVGPSAAAKAYGDLEAQGNAAADKAVAAAPRLQKEAEQNSELYLSEADRIRADRIQKQQFLKARDQLGQTLTKETLRGAIKQAKGEPVTPQDKAVDAQARTLNAQAKVAEVQADTQAGVETAAQPATVGKAKDEATLYQVGITDPNQWKANAIAEFSDLMKNPYSRTDRDSIYDKQERFRQSFLNRLDKVAKVNPELAARIAQEILESQASTKTGMTRTSSAMSYVNSEIGRESAAFDAWRENVRNGLEFIAMGKYRPLKTVASGG